jgi:hypothetical protein
MYVFPTMHSFVIRSGVQGISSTFQQNWSDQFKMGSEEKFASMIEASPRTGLVLISLFGSGLVFAYHSSSSM